MPDRLSKRRQTILLESMKTLLFERTKETFIFGPGKRKDFEELYEIFNDIRVGYHAEYYQPKTEKKTKKTKDYKPEQSLVYVGNQQADKLSVVLSALGFQAEDTHATLVLSRLQAIKEKHTQTKLEAEKKAERALHEKKRNRSSNLKKVRTTKKGPARSEQKQRAIENSRWSRLLNC